MRKRNLLILFIAGLFCFALLPGCEDDPPQSIYDENYVNSAGVPTVTSIVPEGAPYILGGVTTIVVNGSGFLADTSKMNVYFNSTKVAIASVTPTQLKIIAPNMVLDSIKVRVYITGSDKFSDLKFINIRSAYIYVKEVDSSKVSPAAIGFNKAGDLFVSVVLKSGSSGGIYKLSTTGDYTQYALPSTEPYFSGIKLYRDSLIAARRVPRIVSRNTTTGAMSAFTAALPASIEDFDYDSVRALWTGGNTVNGGILRVDSTKAITSFPFAGIIRSVRYYQGSLYVSNEGADSTNAVYKIPVNAAAGTLGTPEKYFDLSAKVGNKLKKVYGITFDNSGNLYVGTDAAAGIYVVAPDRSASALYNGLLGPNCRYMAWGKDAYLYVVREKTSETIAPTGLFKVDMLGKLSAPYFGQ